MSEKDGMPSGWCEEVEADECELWVGRQGNVIYRVWRSYAYGVRTAKTLAVDLDKLVGSKEEVEGFLKSEAGKKLQDDYYWWLKGLMYPVWSCRWVVEPVAECRVRWLSENWLLKLLKERSEAVGAEYVALPIPHYDSSG